MNSLENCIFIIPCLNESGSLDALAANVSLLKQAGAKVLVVDGGSSDGSDQQLEKIADFFVQSAKGRARQMNAGASRCSAIKAKYYCFLHADSFLDQCFIDDFSKTVAQKPSWGFCRVSLSGNQPWSKVIARMMNWRSSLTSVATGDQLIFVASELFWMIGGYDNMPLMEDVAICKKLRKQLKPVVSQATIVTSSRRWQHRGVLRTVVLMWLLRLLYITGVSPKRLYRLYYG